MDYILLRGFVFLLHQLEIFDEFSGHLEDVALHVVGGLISFGEEAFVCRVEFYLHEELVAFGPDVICVN